MLAKRFRGCKGQLTIDFLLAFLYINILIGILFIMHQNYAKNQNLILLRAQEKRIAYIVAEMITESAALNDGTAEIRFEVPSIRYMNKAVPMPCDIIIGQISGQDYVKVSVNVDGMQIDENVAIKRPTGISINNGTNRGKCGQMFVISYA